MPRKDKYHVTTKKETAKASDERAWRRDLSPAGNSDTVVGNTSHEVV